MDKLEKLKPYQILELLTNKEISVYDIKERDDFEKIIDIGIRKNIISLDEINQNAEISILAEDTSDVTQQSDIYFVSRLFHDRLKEYIDNMISFNENGELVITLNGVSKTFVPKA